MSILNQPRDAAVFGVDIGKTIFHVVGLDAAHAPIQKAPFRRETLLQCFARASPVLVGMEACPGSQWLARKPQAMGHTVRIVPAQFVKPFVKSNKNDIIDAEAIAEAVTRPTMRFVEIRTPEQIDLQSAPPGSRPDDRPSNEADQPDARFLPRVWHRDPSGGGQVQGRDTTRAGR